MSPSLRSIGIRVPLFKHVSYLCSVGEDKSNAPGSRSSFLCLGVEFCLLPAVSPKGYDRKHDVGLIECSFCSYLSVRKAAEKLLCRLIHRYRVAMYFALYTMALKWPDFGHNDDPLQVLQHSYFLQTFWSLRGGEN